MWLIWSNEQPSTRVVTEHLWNLLFFNKHAANLVVVFDEPPLVTAYLRTTKSPLQCIENVLKAIVNVMDGVTFPFAQVEQDYDLKRIAAIVLNSGSSL